MLTKLMQLFRKLTGDVRSYVQKVSSSIFFLFIVLASLVQLARDYEKKNREAGEGFLFDYAFGYF